MKSNNHISKIWDIMEKEKTVGLVKRLYSSDAPFRVYGTFQYPESYFGLAFSFNNDIYIDLSSFYDLNELKIALFPDNSFANSNLLIIQLADPENRDIFASLCENLVQAILNLETEPIVIRTVVNQLEKWKTLFQRSNSKGLTQTEQQGLYGELHFMHKILSRNPNSLFNTLQLWVGSEKALKDFQGSTWALEVKTTSTNNPQKITINNERQLDESLWENLYLYHLSIEISKQNGQSLCQKIVLIRELLKNDSPALSLFNSKLFETGYSDKHSHFYNKRFYQIRKENYYKVEQHFPRIKENEICSGVCDVRYSIILANCNEFLIPENRVFYTIES